jgi:hypothetical protein
MRGRTTLFFLCWPSTPAHDTAAWHTTATFDFPFTVTASRLVFDDPVLCTEELV